MNVFTFHQKFLVTFRRSRMKAFRTTFSPTAETRVLDIGGAPNTWLNESRDPTRFPVTLVNLQYPAIAELSEERFTAIEGDATALPFPDASFDIAFSNSVIEHMTTWENQQTFASEARRVGKKLWIQTPARSFPLEPHLLTPFFQYLPRHVQIRIARNFTLWGLMTRPTPEGVDEMVSNIRLLSYREFQQLFPDCRILKERMLGLTKSYIAVRDGD